MVEVEVEVEVEPKLTYEQIRWKRMEENKKRMEQLNLKNLSQALNKPKPSPVKPRTPRKLADLRPVRRSTRVADKPKPNYRDIAAEPLERPRRGYSANRRNLLNRVYASSEERAYAIERAEQLESTLGSESDSPTFVKPMLQSHVTGGFWLGLPVQFCKKHLPHRDETITLVDEQGEEFATKYLADKTGLSGGWRGFSIDHNLVDGDALVFQLVTPTEFKVYIIRAYESEDSEDVGEKEEGDKEQQDVEADTEVLGRTRSAKRIKASK